MSKVSFTTGRILLAIVFLTPIVSATPTAVAEKHAIVITSQTLIADNRNNIVTFEGSAVARSEDLVIYADKMAVSYENSSGEIIKIHASGNVKVHKKGRAIFSKEAIYLGEEEKIIFSGDPKAVDGGNVITGKQIIYFLKDDRTVVKGSRVVLNKNNDE